MPSTASPQTTVAGLHAEAQRLLSAGRLAPAQQACLRILEADRQHADAYFLLGMIATELRRFGNALEFVDRAIDLAPERSEYHAQRGRCLAMLKRDAEAVAAADHAMALGPRDALAYDTLGVVFSRAGDHHRAAQAFGEAVRREPDNPGFQFNLASALKFTGDFDAAEAAYEAAIRVSPRFFKAHHGLAQLRRQTPEHNHVARLEGLLAGSGAAGEGSLHLRHALAKEYEDLGEYARAFEQLAAGKAARRRSQAYDAAADEALFAAMTAAFPEPVAAGGGSDPAGAEAIFIVGMPRTGTTLAERILASHSAVRSAGELQDFGLALKRAAGTPSARVLDPATIAAARDLDLAGVARSYLAAARARVGAAPRFIDKLPLNFLYLGFIARALPAAQLVCLRRHPLDTVLSNFRQLFAVNFSYYDYAGSLEDTARYYVLFHRLMAHWQQVLPGRILELHYEDLVADQEGQSRRLVAHCGLDWEPACLAFQHNAAPVATASAVQVREPLYRRAVDRWRHYAQELEPAQRILMAAGIDVS